MLATGCLMYITAEVRSNRICSAALLVGWTNDETFALVSQQLECSGGGGWGLRFFLDLVIEKVQQRYCHGYLLATRKVIYISVLLHFDNSVAFVTTVD